MTLFELRGRDTTAGNTDDGGRLASHFAQRARLIARLRAARDARHYYQLTGCVAQYTSINIILWTIFSIFAAAHAFLLNTVVLANDHDARPVTSAVVSLIGLLAALAWALLLRRTVGHLRWHQTLVERVEKELRIGKRHQMFPARVAPKGDDPREKDTEPLPTGWRWFRSSVEHPTEGDG